MMEVDRKRHLAAVAVLLLELDEEEPRATERSCWVKDHLGRKHLGIHNQLFKVLVSDPDEYRRLLRVSHDQFEQLLCRVGPRIARQNTVMRRSIHPRFASDAALPCPW